MTDKDTLQRIKELESENQRLNKVNAVLMNRVERSMQSDGGSYSLFESNILLQKTISERTSELEAEVKERKRADRQLRESGQKLLLHIQQTPLGVIEWDVNFRVVEWNMAAERMFGITRDEAIGCRATELIVPEDVREQRQEDFDRLLIKRESTINLYRNIGKKGKELLCNWYNTPLIDDADEVVGVASLVQNVTELKWAEAQLKVEKAYFEQLFECAPEAIVIGDNNGKVIRTNPEFTKMFGYQPEEAAGKLIDDLLAPDLNHKEAVALTKRAANGESISCEGIRHRKDGQPVYASILGTPILTQQGQIAIYTIYRDITEQKKAMEALANEATRRRIFIEDSQDGIVVLDKNGKVYEANRKYAEMLGYSPEEILQLHVWDWDSQWTPEQLLEMIGKTDSSGEHLETRHRRKDGSLIDVEISSNGAMCGGQKLVFCVCRDISDRKRSEEALRESEVKYRTVIENMQDVFYRTDPQGNLIMASPSGAQYLGFDSVEQMIGKNVANDFYAYSEDRTSFLRELQAKGSVHDREVALRRTDGTVFLASANSHFYYDSKGKLLGVEGILRDINERKKTQEALRTSEERYRLLIENASEAIFVIQNFKIGFANKKLAEILGYDNENVIDKSLADYIHPNDKDIVIKRFMARVEGNQVEKPAPFRVLASNGSYKWLDIDAVKILWNGKPATLNFGTDVTDRILAQKELKESENKFRTVFEHSPEPAYLMTDIFLDCNQMACELLGYNREEIIGRSPSEISPEIQPDGRNSAEEAAKYISAAFAGTPQNFYWQHKRKNGSMIDTEVSLTSLTVDGRAMLHAVTRDISQRKRAEEALRRLAAAVEQSVDGIIIMDLNGIIQYVNPAFEKITGRLRDEVVGSLPSFIEPGNQDSKHINKIWAKLKHGKSWSDTRIGHKKDGTPFNEEIMISPVFNSIGTAINYIAVKRDITRQTALEEQLLQSQKMEAVGRLAGGVAHDFNNLLTAIIGYSEILRGKLKGQDSLRADVEEIRKAGERAASLTRQLLAFSRKQIIQPRVLNLNSVVTDMNKMLKRLISENIELSIETDPGLWAVKADPGQIEQIIMNLVVNARDAMPAGGSLVIKTSNAPHISQDQGEKPNLGECVAIIVSDTGTGIPDDIKTHIFEPFFTTKELGKGTGLGLSTVYGIVEQNHGHIEVESKVGLGTSFIIYLPKYSGEASKTGKIEIQKIQSDGSETIMVVEDEDVVRTLTCRVLDELGYKTLPFANPMEAVEACLKGDNQIDLILTDIVMPVMNGNDLSKRIKESLPDMKFLFMSGYTDNVFISHEILESQADFIQKPFKKDVLAMKLREVLDRKVALDGVGK